MHGKCQLRVRRTYSCSPSPLNGWPEKFTRLAQGLQLVNLLHPRPVCPMSMARPLQVLCCPQDQPLPLGAWLPALCSVLGVPAGQAHTYCGAAFLPCCQSPGLRVPTLLIVESKITPCIQQFAEDPLIAWKCCCMDRSAPIKAAAGGRGGVQWVSMATLFPFHG